MNLHLFPKIENKFASYLYYGMRAMVFLSVIGFTLLRDWISVVNTSLILLLMLLPRFIRSKYNVALPFGLELAIVAFVFLSVFLGSFHDYYERFPLWDGILHFQSGLLLGVVGFVVVYMLNSQKDSVSRMSPLFVSFFSVCFSLAMAVVWEVYEYAGDSLFGYTMQESGLPDTMGDLIVNGIGAVIIAIGAYFWMKKNKQIPFKPEGVDNYQPIGR